MSIALEWAINMSKGFRTIYRRAVYPNKKMCIECQD